VVHGKISFNTDIKPIAKQTNMEYTYNRLRDRRKDEMEATKLFRIDFKAMLMSQGKTESEAQAMIDEQNKKVSDKVAHGETSYPSFFR
jgi:hypothetical protein